MEKTCFCMIWGFFSKSKKNTWSWTAIWEKWRGKWPMVWLWRWVALRWACRGLGKPCGAWGEWAQPPRVECHPAAFDWNIWSGADGNTRREIPRCLQSLHASAPRTRVHWTGRSLAKVWKTIEFLSSFSFHQILQCKFKWGQWHPVSNFIPECKWCKTLFFLERILDGHLWLPWNLHRPLGGALPPRPSSGSRNPWLTCAAGGTSREPPIKGYQFRLSQVQKFSTHTQIVMNCLLEGATSWRSGNRQTKVVRNKSKSWIKAAGVFSVLCVICSL